MLTGFPLARAMMETYGFYREMLPVADEYARRCGQAMLDNYHCFYAVCTHYAQDPSVQRVVAALGEPDVDTRLAQLVRRAAPVAAIAEISPLLLRMWWDVGSDAQAVYQSEPSAHRVLLFFLSRPDTVGHAVFARAGVDTQALTRELVHSGREPYPVIAEFYYAEMFRVTTALGGLRRKYATRRGPGA